ncbi:MAG: helix-turn-helix domain-containing protein [Azoarcus sp.]|nr:helix-turn-helix domain-containing protein [Azoarcus sp.]
MPPTTNETRAAFHGQRVLAAWLETHPGIQSVQISDGRNPSSSVELPGTALRLLVDILGKIAEGNAVQVVPVRAEMTTQEAADLLNVSRPHLVKLLEEGSLPFHKVGKHRRVHVADVMAFKRKRELDSEQAMIELERQAQELNMGYE